MAAGSSGRTGRKGVRPLAAGQGGVALVLVLWLVVLLTVIGGTHARNVRVDSRLALNQLEVARAAALAEAGVQRAILRILSTQKDQGWSYDGSVHELKLDGGTAYISIINAAGLVDLNSAPQELLDGLLARQDLPDDERLALVDAILDWRDTDDLRRLHGAEARDYRFARRDYEPRNGAFKTSDELRYVLGMSAPLFDLIRPLVTVHSGKTGVNPKFAPPEVLRALPGAEPEQVDAYLTARQAEGLPSSLTGVGGTVGSGRSSSYHIRVRAEGPEGAGAYREAVVVPAGGGGRLYTVVSWREGIGVEERRGGG